MSRPGYDSTSPPGDVAQALERLRALGGRITQARRELVELFYSRDLGWTATDIANQFPDLDPATVYRALNHLEQAGIVEHAHLGHGPATYRRAGGRTILAVCERCGAVVHVPQAELDAIRDRFLDAYGFVVDVRHFALTGHCAGCSAGDADAPVEGGADAPAPGGAAF